jgi:hypothetical protein
MKEKGERILKEREDIPYTIISHTSLPEEFGIFLTGSGLKAILKEMRDGEDLIITICSDNNNRFKIVDTHNKYGGKVNEYK